MTSQRNALNKIAIFNPLIFGINGIKLLQTVLINNLSDLIIRLVTHRPRGIYFQPRIYPDTHHATRTILEIAFEHRNVRCQQTQQATSLHQSTVAMSLRGE